MSPLNPEHRRYVLEAVAVWLDELAEAESFPLVVTSEVVRSFAPTPDLFTVLGQRPR